MGAGALMVRASTCYAKGCGFDTHVGIFPDFFCRVICHAGVDLCCLSFIVTLRVGILFLLLYNDIQLLDLCT